jgi:hypothetical protein
MGRKDIQRHAKKMVQAGHFVGTVNSMTKPLHRLGQRRMGSMWKERFGRSGNSALPETPCGAIGIE